MITQRKGLQTEAIHEHQTETVELYHLDKWMMPLIEVQELCNFKKFQTKIKLESDINQCK
jgi:hypothetical protein